MRTGGYGRMMYTTYSEVMIEPETDDLPTTKAQKPRSGPHVRRSAFSRSDALTHRSAPIARRSGLSCPVVFGAHRLPLIGPARPSALITHRSSLIALHELALGRPRPPTPAQVALLLDGAAEQPLGGHLVFLT